MTKALVFLAAIAAAIPATKAVPQESKARTVEQFTCKDVMRERSADRDVAIAFLHGVLLGKSGESKFDLDVLHKQSDAFIERCLDNPNERAIDAMTGIKR